MKLGIIYKVTNTLDGTSYIGATRTTLVQRRSSHVCAARKEGRLLSALHAAIRAHGAVNFEWVVLRSVPMEQLDTAEIDEIKAARQRGEQLYNVTDGGRKPRGYSIRRGRPDVRVNGKTYAEWSAELGMKESTLRANMSRYKVLTLPPRQRHSMETRAKMSVARKKYWAKPETETEKHRENIAASNRSRVQAS